MASGRAAAGGLRRYSPPISAAEPAANACLSASSVSGSRRAISSITSPETSRLRGRPPANSSRNGWPQRARGHQRQVEQPGFDGVEILAGLVQPIEGRLEVLPRGGRVARRGPRRPPPGRPFAAPPRRGCSCSAACASAARPEDGNSPGPENRPPGRDRARRLVAAEGTSHFR